MTSTSQDDERDAVALLRPLAGEQSGPARIDVARAMAEGRRRRLSRWWVTGTAIVAVTTTTAAGGTLAFAALDRPARDPSGRWLVGRTYPVSGSQHRPLVLWRDGKLAGEAEVSGSDQRFEDITSKGVAVGYSYDPGVKPFAYRNGKVIAMRGGEGAASAINETGIVVGALGETYQGRPARWSSVTPSPSRCPCPPG